MADANSTLAELFDKVPADIAAYFDQIADGSLSGHDELELNLLPIADAARLTKDFRDFHPVVDYLRGVILDDPNTSNHHVYLALPPCAGTVFYLSHDGDSRIVFPTSAAFLDAARQALKTGRSLTLLHPAAGIQLDDQLGLNQLIVGVLNGQFDCDRTAVILALVSSMDLTDSALLERLIAYDDFYVAEAVGDAITRRPRRELRAIAETCQDHQHPQVARAGARAVAAINALH